MEEILSKLKDMINLAWNMFNKEYNPDANPVIGLDKGKLVLWVFYKGKFWGIELEEKDFDFNNLESEMLRNKLEIEKWIFENPDEKGDDENGK